MKIPEKILNEWKHQKGPIILATVNAQGIPNIIYATCVNLYEDERFVVADNYFGKTRENLKIPGKGALLFITEQGTSYQLKGQLEYHSEGPIFEDMKRWNPAKHPGVAAAALRVEAAYSGSEKLL